jgi:hypothetical protein
MPRRETPKAEEPQSRGQAANDLAACQFGAMELPFGGKKKIGSFASGSIV